MYFSVWVALGYVGTLCGFVGFWVLFWVFWVLCCVIEVFFGGFGCLGLGFVVLDFGCGLGVVSGFLGIWLGLLLLVLRFAWFPLGSLLLWFTVGVCCSLLA